MPLPKDRSLGDDAQPRCVIVDGLNVIRLVGRHQPRLELLLHALLEVAIPAGDFLCIFDANTWYELKDKQGSLHADVYARLCEEHPYYFSECTGGTPADRYVLSEARARSGHVVSNDRYRDYVHVHPWVKAEPDRFIRLNVVRNALHVGDHRVLLESNLRSLERDLGKALNNRRVDGAPQHFEETQNDTCLVAVAGYSSR